MPDFQHQHAAHCESGVTSTLLTHYGCPISEPMAFGLSASLMFVHFPFIIVGGIPLTSYRMPPGNVYKGTAKRIGAQIKSQRFRDAAAGMAALDEQLSAGRAVGLQVSVYHLPFFPPEMRFHFNAHNLIVYGREGDDYLISDPVFEEPQRCPAADLQRARFAKGKLAPKGLMYYPTAVPSEIDLAKVAPDAIRRNCKMMLQPIMPWVGVKAIRRMGQTMADLPNNRPDMRAQRLFISSVVRMQEEIGTGGAGFRFVYASFLQELGQALNDERLLQASEKMTAVGDTWRKFALAGAKLCRKDVNPTAESYQQLQEILLNCAEQEKQLYKALKSV